MSEFMRRLRENFEALYRLHFKPNGDHSLEWLDHPLDLDGDEPRYLMSHPDLYFQFYQTGFTDALTEKSKRIAELEASLADAIEAQQVIGLKLAHAEAENARLKTPAAKWREAGEPDPHGDYYDCERAKLCMGHLTDDELANEVFMKGGIGELTAAKERIRWLSRLVVRLQDHSSPALGGPTADAAPSCEQPS